MPNSRWVKKYLPNGVMNVVSFAISGSRGICQNPGAASSLEKTDDPSADESHRPRLRSRNVLFSPPGRVSSDLRRSGPWR